MTRLIRKPELEKITGLSHSTIWRLEKAGRFPQRIKLPVNAVAWRLDEVEKWMLQQPRVATLPFPNQDITCDSKPSPE